MSNEHEALKPSDGQAARAVMAEMNCGSQFYLILKDAFRLHRIATEEALATPSPSTDTLEADSGMSGDAVERAELLWANLPTRRKWTDLATHEKALVCHQIARIAALGGSHD